jgi:putative membrane protein
VLTVAAVAIVVAALAHVLFFVMESVLFARPAVWRRFSVQSQHDADTIRPWALNQGYYNLFLALGGLAGAVALALDERTVGVTLIAFAAASMAGAGVVLLASGGARYLQAAAVQAVPPLVALIALGVHAG